METIIFTADDFGLCEAVNEAVETAHRDGVLTHASLMVAGAAAADAVARARRLPTLKVGLHLVVIEGPAVLPPDRIPALVDHRGWFPSDQFRLGLRYILPHVRRQLAAEIEAQFDAFARTGLRLDHVNAHKHYQLHPTVAGLLLRIGRRYGLAASRAPIEPRAVLAAVDGTRAPPAWLTAPWARLLRARYRAAGLTMADQVFGLAWSGAMTPARLSGLIAGTGEGLTEIYLHPATDGDFDGAAPGYRYADELAALLAPETREAVRASGAELCAFS